MTPPQLAALRHIRIKLRPLPPPPRSPRGGARGKGAKGQRAFLAEPRPVAALLLFLWLSERSDGIFLGLSYLVSFSVCLAVDGFAFTRQAGCAPPAPLKWKSLLLSLSNPS